MDSVQWRIKGSDAVISLVNTPWRTGNTSDKLEEDFYIDYVKKIFNNVEKQQLVAPIYNGIISEIGVLIKPDQGIACTSDWIERYKNIQLIPSSSENDKHGQWINGCNMFVSKLRGYKHFFTFEFDMTFILHVYLVEVATSNGIDNNTNFPLNINLQFRNEDNVHNITLKCPLVEKNILSVESRFSKQFVEITLRNCHEHWPVEINEVINSSSIIYEKVMGTIPLTIASRERYNFLYKTQPLGATTFLSIKWRPLISEYSEWQWSQVCVSGDDLEMSQKELNIYCSLNGIQEPIVSINMRIVALKTLDLVLENMNYGSILSNDVLVPVTNIIVIGKVEEGSEKVIVLHYNMISPGLNKLPPFQLKDLITGQCFTPEKDYHIMTSVYHKPKNLPVE
ncbi:hypothetical protein BdWA1_003072 [Babesia duncani]|uniref:Uncharacterized protein n=1 Tax=Babesia duncani TaxID=323732 RepID=A0AAD9PIW8_9APIC|nr:hypothetical protein BdWA1_003072 [Babesia duncani]